ncbi:MAG: dihydroorotase family protein [Candidatus Micrarchaeota archaeon]
MSTTVIKGAKAFIEGRFTDCDVLINGSVIAGIGKNLKGEKSMDARGLVLLPGLIDPHVHLRQPGAEYKEDFNSGSRAAVAGGFTTIMDMPNNNPPTTTFARLEEKKLLAKKAVCDVRFHFGGTDDNFEEVRKVNPESMKIYLGLTTGELYLRQPHSLERHFENIYPKSVLFFHASANGPEEQSIADTLDNIGRVGELSGRYLRKFHIAHASCGAEVARTREFEKGTVEVAPHHLFLNSKDAKKLGVNGTVYPPLRSEKRRKSLWKEFDKIDCIGSDHAPHTLEDKEEGAHGFPGLETTLPLMLDACHRKLFRLEEIIPMMSHRPAQIFGLEKVGEIREGNFANLTLVDLKKEWTVKGEELQTKCKWSPYDGKKLKGKVHSVLYKGRLVIEDGKF